MSRENELNLGGGDDRKTMVPLSSIEEDDMEG